MNVTWRILTPPLLPGAVAIIELDASLPAALDQVLIQLGCGSVKVESAPLRNVAGIDSGLVARWTPTLCHLMVHGGPAVVRALSDHFVRMGLPHHPRARDCIEARNLIEERLLLALPVAASPLAVDLLLDQPRRWQAFPDHPVASTPRDARLRRLIVPPLVVMLGPANIGKSSLLNALADRPVAAVADEPGTTRDHVGATIDLAGLVVRFIDTPGFRDDSHLVEAQAFAAVEPLLPKADLILLCGDARAGPEKITLPPCVPLLRVGLRADLGPARLADISISIHHPESLPVFVKRLRDELLPASDLLNPAPWVFWDPVPTHSGPSAPAGV